jgi:hypothetical protein
MRKYCGIRTAHPAALGGRSTGALGDQSFMRFSIPRWYFHNVKLYATIVIALFGGYLIYEIVQHGLQWALSPANLTWYGRNAGEVLILVGLVSAVRIDK